MCNLAERIEERALKKGVEQGIEQEKIESVKTLISKLNITFEEAIRILEVPEYLVDRCRECVMQA